MMEGVLWTSDNDGCGVGEKSLGCGHILRRRSPERLFSLEDTIAEISTRGVLTALSKSGRPVPHQWPRKSPDV
jgi:hypothetical protein